MTRPRLLLALLLLLALALRLVRLPARWCATAWLYAAYPWETVVALREGRLPPFTGLHPPLWPLLHALSELLLPVPLGWLLASTLASTLAAALLARRSPLAGLLVATSPIQLAYAAEVNGYPLAAALVALVLVLRPAAADGRWLPLALAGALAGWTHALAGLAVALVALTLPRPLALRALLLLVVAAAPLVLPALRATGEGPTQPPWKPALVLADAVDRFGLLWLLAAPAALLGARRQPWLLVPALGLPLALAALTAAGLAAPHQFPYWTLLGLPLALLAGAADRPLARWLALAVALAHAGLALAQGLPRLAALRADLLRTRAVDVALAELEAPWGCVGEPSPGCAGDALYLVLPRRVDDDDKRLLDPALWRLRPWRALPAVVPSAMDWGDHRNGQPRLHQGFVVYVDDHVRERVLDAAAAHRRLWVVLEAGADSAEGRALRTLLEAPGEAVGEGTGEGVIWRLGEG